MFLMVNNNINKISNAYKLNCIPYQSVDNMHLYFLSAYNYKKYRKSSIQDDLNKLYDNRPTLSSNGEEHSSKFHRKSSNANHGEGKRNEKDILQYTRILISNQTIVITYIIYHVIHIFFTSLKMH